MKQFNKFFFGLLALLTVGSLQAQERYLDEIFTDVSVQKNVSYGANITVITVASTGAPSLDTLKMDIYSPEGDDATDRPVVIYWHTGSFLPAILNGQVTGTKEDSTGAEICRRLARQGYVAISATYRQGWNPLGTQDVRTGTLLNAAYRGIQDARTAIRYLRRSVAEFGNPYGIDAEKITLWGQGTGGYISYGAAFLDSYDEIVLDKFLDENAQIYVDSSLSGDVYGLNMRPLNVANHVGYSSDFKLAVNVGGALGDTSWIDGTADEPAVIGFHVLKDPFAPYLDGAVIVPTTQEFVVNVSGTRRVAEMTNNNGTNAVFQSANDDVSGTTLSSMVNLRNKAYQQVPITIGGQNILMSVDNMYPFVTDTIASGPWEWWDYTTLTFYVAAVNAATGSNYDPAVLDATNKILNPDMSREKGMAYVDTMMAYFNPRAYLALNLATNTKEVLAPETVELTVGPNPVSTSAFIQTAADKPMKNLALYHLNGKMMRGIMNVNSSTYELQRGNLPPGIYILQAEFEDGIVAKKLVFN